MADIELNAHNVTRITVTVTEGTDERFWRELTIESKDGSSLRINLFGNRHGNLNTVLVDSDGREVRA